MVGDGRGERPLPEPTENELVTLTKAAHDEAGLDARLTQLADRLARLELRPRAPLAEFTSMGVGGPSRWMATVGSEDALNELLKLLRAEKARWMMLGGGSNTVFTDAGFNGVVIRLGAGFREIALGPDAEQVTAGAAAALSAVMNYAKRNGLAGLEWAAGVPGTLGGALAGNAGTGAGEICPQTAAVEVIASDGCHRVRRHGDFTFGYRTSSLVSDIILRATIQLRSGAEEDIAGRIEAALAKRRTQPVGKRTSGCMFKNPTGDAAGRLIDAAGLKDLRIGGARVAGEHANFVVNDSGASSADIAQLMELVRQRVREDSGVELEDEIRFVGD